MNPTMIGFSSHINFQNAELFALTYGALVVQLIQDYEDYAEVNTQLEKMGYNIGCRIIEDFLARSGLGRCSDFREVGEVVAKVGLSPLLHPILSSKSANPGRLQGVFKHHTDGHTLGACSICTLIATTIGLKSCSFFDICRNILYTGSG
jgi:Transport protein particle (TRAPP) component